MNHHAHHRRRATATRVAVALTVAAAAFGGGMAATVFTRSSTPDVATVPSPRGDNTGPVIARPAPTEEPTAAPQPGQAYAAPIAAPEVVTTPEPAPTPAITIDPAAFRHLTPLTPKPATTADPTPTPTPTATVLNEDDPGWDCKTMGNRTCGTYNGDGTFTTTTYDEHGNITRTDVVGLAPVTP